MSTQPKRFVTPEEYLELDRKAQFKSEYWRGEMFAMSGARRAHNLVQTNLARELSQQLRATPCEVYVSDMRVLVGDGYTYLYPDAVVVCAKPLFVDGQFDALINPTVLIEVLSPSTEAYDRGEKFLLYESIESLHEYLIISTDHMHIDLFTRQSGGAWLLRMFTRENELIELTSVDCRLKVADLYEKIEFFAGPTEMTPLNLP